MTCLSGHSSSIYNFAINAFFFSHTSDDIEVFILVESRGQNKDWRTKRERKNKVYVEEEEGRKSRDRGGAI